LSKTISIGYATMEPNDTPETLLKRADLALYEAKHGGRNKVCPLPRDSYALPPSRVAAREQIANDMPAMQSPNLKIAIAPATAQEKEDLGISALPYAQKSEF
ncbi:MAG: diguanylate cyclase domain-containing protein, partial [Rickettsiales bacterium]